MHSTVNVLNGKSGYIYIPKIKEAVKRKMFHDTNYINVQPKTTTKQSIWFITTQRVLAVSVTTVQGKKLAMGG